MAWAGLRPTWARLLHSLIWSTTCCELVAPNPATSAGLFAWPADVDGRSMGNHRVRFNVAAEEARGDAVRLHVLWRRSDRHTDTAVHTVRLGAYGEQAVTQAVVVSSTAEALDLVLQPDARGGSYAAYYLPYYYAQPEGYHYNVTYEPARCTADEAWMRNHALLPTQLPSGRWRREIPLVAANQTWLDARSDFDAFTEMEQTASSAEVADLLARYPIKRLLAWPEPRNKSRHIRLLDQLPWHWTVVPPFSAFTATVQPGEFFVFQVGVWAARCSLTDIQVTFPTMRLMCGRNNSGKGDKELANDEVGASIQANAWRCFNTGGVSSSGRPFLRQLNANHSTVQALWLGVEIPTSLSELVRSSDSCHLTGELVVSSEEAHGEKIPVKLGISSASPPADFGDSDLTRMSRTRWLDDSVGISDTVVSPLTPIVVDRQLRTLHILRRTVTLSSTGLPSGISSFGSAVLSRPVALDLTVVGDGGGHQMRPQWDAVSFAFTSVGNATVRWRAVSRAMLTDNHTLLLLAVNGTLSFEGYIDLDFTLEAACNASCKVAAVAFAAAGPVIHISNAVLTVAQTPSMSKYFMGLGQQGSTSQALMEKWGNVGWKWARHAFENTLWVGGVDGGLRTRLKGLTDSWIAPWAKVDSFPAFW